MHKLVVGIGNCGKQYEGTRHNLGFRAVHKILDDEGIAPKFEARNDADVQLITLDGVRVLLVKPRTSVNLTGDAVSTWLKACELSVSDLLLIHDELDIKPGLAKMRRGGGPGGHRGVADVITKAGAAFCRIKVGIGKPDDSIGITQWVLGIPSAADERRISDVLQIVAKAVKMWVHDDLHQAITLINTRTSLPEDLEQDATAEKSSTATSGHSEGKTANERPAEKPGTAKKGRPNLIRSSIALLTSRGGWKAILRRLHPGRIWRSWFLSRRVAALYRRTIAKRTRVVAVVGSLGKTTTTKAVAVTFGLPAKQVSRRNEFGYVAMALLRIRPSQTHAVIEVGIGARGQMEPYAKLVRPDIAVVTCIASEHHRELGSLEQIREEKANMVRALPPTGLAVLNGDDPHVMRMRSYTQARVVTYGFDPDCDIRASDVELQWPHGTEFCLHAHGQRRQVKTRLFGQNFAYSILAAAAVGLAEGISLDQVVGSLEAVKPAPQRLDVTPLGNGAIILRDDYKSPLESIDAALEVLSQISCRRKLVIFGSISDPIGNQQHVHREVGARVAGIADIAIFFGNNCQPYAAGAVRGGMSREAITKAGRSVDAVLDAIPEDLGDGDVILLKGRVCERLERIALALSGRHVRCKIPSCDLSEYCRCDGCDMLERGWSGAPPAGS